MCVCVYMHIHIYIYMAHLILIWNERIDPGRSQPWGAGGREVWTPLDLSETAAALVPQDRRMDRSPGAAERFCVFVALSPLKGRWSHGRF